MTTDFFVLLLFSQLCNCEDLLYFSSYFSPAPPGNIPPSPPPPSPAPPSPGTIHASDLVHTQTPPNLLVAFAGDWGLEDEEDYSPDVWELIAEEEADFTVLLGDITYKDLDEDDEAGIPEFMEMINDLVGEDHPIFPVAGNHDEESWWHDTDKGDDFDGFRKSFWERLQKQNLAHHCEPSNGDDFGVCTRCNYKGIHMVLLGVGSMDSELNVDFEDFTQETFVDSPSRWRICAFHNIMEKFQIGDEKDETGYDIYETCLDHGAIIATAHEHSYSRTKCMEEYSDNPKYMDIDGYDEHDPIILDKGVNFAFVAGTGGRGLRDYEDDRIDEDWWAHAAGSNSDPPLSYGALFCRFFVDDDPSLASCYFKEIPGNHSPDETIHGIVRDQFFVRTQLDDTGGMPVAGYDLDDRVSARQDAGISDIMKQFIESETPSKSDSSSDVQDSPDATRGAKDIYDETSSLTDQDFLVEQSQGQEYIVNPDDAVHVENDGGAGESDMDDIQTGNNAEQGASDVSKRVVEESSGSLLESIDAEQSSNVLETSGMENWDSPDMVQLDSPDVSQMDSPNIKLSASNGVHLLDPPDMEQSDTQSVEQSDTQSVDQLDSQSVEQLDPPDTAKLDTRDALEPGAEQSGLVVGSTHSEQSSLESGNFELSENMLDDIEQSLTDGKGVEGLDDLLTSQSSIAEQAEGINSY